MHEIDLYASDDHRITSFQHARPPAGVVIAFTPRFNRILDGFGFGGKFVLEQGLDLVAVKTRTGNWHQDLPAEALQAIIAHLEQTGRGRLGRIGYGSSMGAYAAIKFSRRLGLERVVAISPQHDINQSWDTRFSAEQDYAGTIDAITEADLQPGCIFFVAADPYDLDGLHLNELRKIIPQPQFVETAVPFAGHPVGHLMMSAGLFKAYSAAAFKGQTPCLDRTEIRKARQNTPTYLIALVNQCIVHKKLAWAERICHQSMVKKPDATFLGLLSHVLQQMGRDDEAIKAARESVEAAPENEHFLKRYCSLLLQRDRLHEAVPELEAAVGSMPASAGIAPLLEKARRICGAFNNAVVPPLQPELSGTVQIRGCAARFSIPNVVGGWAISTDKTGQGHDIEISVYLDGRLIGEGKPTEVRMDILNEPGWLSGFNIACTEAIPNEAIAFETIRLEARKAGLPASTLPVWDNARALAFARLFEVHPGPGEAAAATIIEGISRSKRLEKQQRDGLVKVLLEHFRDKFVAP